MIRATFDLRLAGALSQRDAALARLTDDLSEQGFVLDDDFMPFDSPAAGVGIRFHTLGALRAALGLLPRLGVYAIETDRASI